MIDSPPSREHLMSRWDEWRKYISEGGGASWPRDEFERLLDYLYELIEESENKK